MNYIEKGNKSNSNTLGISGAYITNIPKGNTQDVPETTVSRLLRGSKADRELFYCAMNDYSFADYVTAWFLGDDDGEVLCFKQYMAIKAEVMRFVEESSK